MELSPSEGLAKGPVWWSNVVRHHTTTITGCDLKGQALSVKEVVALPVLSPVPGHGHPSCSGPFDGHAMNIASTSYVCDEDEVEVGMAINGESDASLSPTGYPASTQPQYVPVQ